MRFLLLAFLVQTGAALVTDNSDAEARGAHVVRRSADGVDPFLRAAGNLLWAWGEDAAARAAEETIKYGVKKGTEWAYDKASNYVANYALGKVQAGVDHLQTLFREAAADKPESKEAMEQWANDPENKLTKPGLMDGVMKAAHDLGEVADQIKDMVNDPNLPSNKDGSFVARFLETDPFEPGPELQLEIAEQLNIVVPDRSGVGSEREQAREALSKLSRDDQRKIFATAMATGEWEPPDMESLGPKAMLEFVAETTIKDVLQDRIDNYDLLRDGAIEQGKQAMMDLTKTLDAARLSLLNQQREAYLQAQKLQDEAWQRIQRQQEAFRQGFQQRAVSFQATELNPTFAQSVASRGGNYNSHSFFNQFE